MQSTPAHSKNNSATELISGFVEAWANRARRKGATKGVFVLDGARLTDVETGSATGLLPLFIWHADNLYRYGMGGQGLGVDFKADEGALLQRVVDLGRLTRATSEVLCFVVEAAEDARQHLPQSSSVPGAVELRGLVNQFADHMGLTAGPVAEAAAAAKLHA